MSSLFAPAFAQMSPDPFSVQWRDRPHIKYSTGHRMDYYLECRGNEAAEQVRSKLWEFALAFETWGPQPDTTPVFST
jgi:hypothetical protein